MKLNMLKINQLSKIELEDREMHSLLGGECNQCACGCYVASTAANGTANAGYGYTYTAGWGSGDDDTCACLGGSDCVNGAGKGYNL